MCVVSNVGDHYSRRDAWPTWPPQVPFPTREPDKSFLPEYLQVIAENVRLKKQVEQMKAELAAAKAQDIRDGNPDCEMEDKVIILKKIAKMFGIELNEVFPD